MKGQKATSVLDDPIEYNVKVEYIIKPAVLENLFVSCFEGGYSPWIRQVDLVSGKQDPRSPVVWWGHPELYASPFKIKIVYDREQDAEGEGGGAMTINSYRIRVGLQTLASEYPHVFKEIVDDNIDALIGDAFVQCCVFGKLVYA